jgi:hypothetical protein
VKADTDREGSENVSGLPMLYCDSCEENTFVLDEVTVFCCCDRQQFREFEKMTVEKVKPIQPGTVIPF